MKNIIKLIPFTFLVIGLVTKSNAQVQKGADIDGEAANDKSGALSMPDANTIAIGAYYHGGNGSASGDVRVFNWNGSSWLQKGANINGEAAGDWSGTSVCMPDANTVAIGAPENDANGSGAGQVRVYKWDGGSWVQKGGDIDGEAAGDYSGGAVSMPDSNTVAIGAIFNGSTTGQVRVYEWNGSTWLQKGADIDGEAVGDYSGNTVSMPDANTIAIGAPRNDGNGTDAGQVRIYTWNGNTWVQKGADLEGVAHNCLGRSVSMPDANTIGIGAAVAGLSSVTAPSYVRIYIWNGGNWVQKGLDINGEAIGDISGSSVSMPDINTIAIGAPQNAGNGINSGHTRIFVWNGTNWVQLGFDIDGETSEDRSGSSVSMPNANTIAIGAQQNSGSWPNAGHARIFNLNTLGIIQNSFGKEISFSPNPTKKEVTIDLGANYSNISIVIRNPLGQVVSTEKSKSTRKLSLNLYGEPGIYQVEMMAENRMIIFKIIKE